MKRFLLIILISANCFFCLYGQTNDYWKNYTGPYGGTINDIVFSNNVYIVSTPNGVYRSTDFTANWTKVTVGTDQVFTDLEVAGGKVYITTSAGPRIYISSDDGATWTQFATNANGVTGTITKIKVAPNGFIFLADNNSSNNRIYKSTTAGGATFTSNFTSTVINDLDVDNLNNAYLSTTSLGVRKTPDAINFTNSTGTLANVNVVSTVINSTGVIFSLTAAGPHKSTAANGTVYGSVKSNLTDTNFSGILDLDPSGNIYLLNNTINGANPLRLFTTTAASAGATWSAGVAYAAPNVPATASYFQSTTSWFAAFGSSGLFSTTSTGSLYTQNSTGITAMPATSRLGITQNNWLLLANTSGLGLFRSCETCTGWLFNGVSSSFTNRTFNGFLKLADNSMLAYGNGVIRSLNDGINWNLQHDTQVIPEMVSTDGTNLFSYALTGTTLLKSINQGVNWTTTTLTGLPGTPNRIQIDASGNLFFKVANEIYKVNAGGSSGTKLAALTATTIQDFRVVGTGIYVLGNSNTLFISSDGGATFLSKLTPPNPSGFWVYDSKNMFMRAGTNSMFFSTDGGGIWNNRPLVDAEAIATDVLIAPSTFMYVATSNSQVNKSLNVVVAPNAPTNLTVLSKSFNNVDLIWTDNSNNESDYVIEASIGNNTSYINTGYRTGIVSNSLNKVNVNISGLTKSTKYFFRVMAKNGAGFSGYSNEVTETTIDQCTSAIPNNRSWTGTATAEPGSTPTGNTPYSSNTVNIVSIPSSPNDYIASKYEFGIDPIGPFDKVVFEESCGQTVIFEDYSISNGNGTWDGTTLVLKWQDSPFNETSFKAKTTYTLNPTDPTPAAPLLNAYLYSSTEILLNWSAIAFAQQYVIERSSVSGSGYVQIATVNFPTSIYIDRNLTTNAGYYYRIIAKNISNTLSPPSPEAGVTVKAGLFRPVENDIQRNFEPQQGVSWGDLDGDGDEDMTLPAINNTAGQIVPPIFYENMGNGRDFTRRDIAVLANENTASSRSINIFDFNNDGKLDLYIGRIGTNVSDLLLINNGGWNFTKTVLSPTSFTSSFKSTTAVDYDKDGRVDVFISNDPNAAAASLTNQLLKNVNGVLTEIPAGPFVTDLMSGRNNSWADYDNDGDQDAFVHDTGSPARPNRLYKNNGDGTFTRVTGLIFDTDLFTGARTSSWGDIDNDGDLDLYVGSTSPAQADRLYQNNGNGTFTKLTGDPTETLTLSYGSSFGDIDNDGDLDLVVINGNTLNVSGQYDDDGANSIFFNNGSGVFTKYTTTELITHPKIFEIGCSLADFDKDGFLDIYPAKGATTAVDLPNFLYKNTLSPSTARSWIQLRLTGVLSNKAAIGTRIKLITTVPARTQIREISSHTGYGSQNSLIAHFGLGTASTIASIEIKWPSGFVQTILNPGINQILDVVEDVHADITFTAPPTLNKGFNTTTFSLGATTNFGAITDIVLSYRKISGTTFIDLPGVFNATNSKWEFAVLESFFDGNGMEYNITAKSGSNVIGRLPANVNSNFYTYLNYKADVNAIPSDRLGFGGAVANWKIFTIPFDLGTNNNVPTVFDELKGLTDKVDWRMLSYKDNVAWGEYPNDFASFTRGKGYFINIRTSIDLKIPEAAASNNRKTLFSMAIKKGWNQIGNPYLTPINWADVIALNTLTGTMAQLKTYNATGYTNASTLQPFEGGFVLADADGTVTIPFQGQTVVGGRISQGLESGDWIVPITLKQANVENTFGGVGMTKSAESSFDRFDDFNAPRLFDFIEMNFNHPEHFVKQFARDVVPASQEHTWSFKVNSNSLGTASMNWTSDDVKSAPKDVFLFDESKQKLINMKVNSDYTFVTKTTSDFKIYYGDDLEKKIKPTKIMLGKAYPNPSTGTTTVAFTLADQKTSYHVLLDILDGMGKRVATLVNGIYEPGFYTSVWDASQQETSAGLYLYRLTVTGERGQETQIEKIILKK